MFDQKSGMVDQQVLNSTHFFMFGRKLLHHIEGGGGGLNGSQGHFLRIVFLRKRSRFPLEQGGGGTKIKGWGEGADIEL